MTKTEKRKPGKPEFVPTEAHRNLISSLRAMDASAEDIRALIINPYTGAAISKSTFWKHFKPELEVAKEKIKASLFATAFKRAKEGGAGSVPLLIFLLKTVCGLREGSVVRHEHDVKSGVLVAPADVNRDEWMRKIDGGKKNEGAA